MISVSLIKDCLGIVKTVWTWEIVMGIGSFFLTGNFGDEILLRGEECDDPEFLYIWNVNI